MTEDWKSRWEEGHIGWHEPEGNPALRKYWPAKGDGESVVVPLCGKSPDLLWLANQGYEVTGVELSEIAVRAFFAETGLPFELSETDGFLIFRCSSPGITLACGDFFDFSSNPFDALYDRASLIALPGELRPEYIRHTKSLLKADSIQLLITLEYDQSKVDGPPFSVSAGEVASYWDDMQCVWSGNAIDDTPQKFREAGLTEVTESVWLTR